MGKIHEALQRAEEDRAKVGTAPAAGAVAAHRELDPPHTKRPGRPRTSRGERLRDGRRSRVMTADDGSSVTEEYRSLRARIQSIRRERPLTTLLVTSALRGEGKTTTAVNLALSFGLDREQNTCLVDADLRTPAVHHALLETPDTGLAELLDTDAKLEEALIRVPDTRLSVLTVRALPSQPSELLASRRMVGLLEELGSRFDTVIIDSPPILGLPDAVTLADLCDAMLLVIGSGASSGTDIDAALARIDSGKAIGCVFNRSTETSQPYGVYYGPGRN